jgi:hypothetical protein
MEAAAEYIWRDAVLGLGRPRVGRPQLGPKAHQIGDTTPWQILDVNLFRRFPLTQGEFRHETGAIGKSLLPTIYRTSKTESVCDLGVRWFRSGTGGCELLIFVHVVLVLLLVVSIMVLNRCRLSPLMGCRRGRGWCKGNRRWTGGRTAACKRVRIYLRAVSLHFTFSVASIIWRHKSTSHSSF